MLTIFSIPKPFTNPHINIIQRNAIQSWVELRPKCEVILFGDDEGVAKTALELGVKHIPQIKKNEFGTPLLNSVFDITQKIAKNKLVTYINTDIILLDNLITAVKNIKLPKFLIAGRRWNLEIKKPIPFRDSNWQKQLWNQIIKNGQLCRYTGIDYFVFPKDIPHGMPAFAVGRVGWDNWFLYKIRSLNIPLIDATAVITAIHQKHDYTHCKGGEKGISYGPEGQRNLKLVGGISRAYSLRNANFLLTKKGLKPKKSFTPARLACQYLGALPFFYPRLAGILTIFLLPGKLTMVCFKKIQQYLLKKHLLAK